MAIRGNSRGVYAWNNERIEGIRANPPTDFSSYDLVITSDTAPISKMLLLPPAIVESNLIIWVCNRFDVNNYDDLQYHSNFLCNCVFIS